MTGSTLRYAGFWRRLVAALIDSAFTWAVSWPMVWLLSVPGLAHPVDDFEQLVEELLAARPRRFYAACALLVVIDCVYRAVLESSRWQATLGKLAVGIRVTDPAGERIALGRALGRVLLRWLSTLAIYAGHLIQPFTARRQAFHDVLAGTLVLRGGA